MGRGAAGRGMSRKEGMLSSFMIGRGLRRPDRRLHTQNVEKLSSSIQESLVQDINKKYLYCAGKMELTIRIYHMYVYSLISLWVIKDVGP